VLGSAAAFGLWHVLPAWNINTVNPVVTGADLSRVTAIGSAVVGTALAGIVMAWVRLRGRHVLASALLHVATNSGGFLVAWLVLRT
jgi:membrane protease YdiL (CAAX protease family)